MAIALVDVATAANQSPFASQVLGALQAAVTAILGELATTADHRIRVKFAEKAQLNLVAYATAMAPAVANNLPGTYSDLKNVTDTDVKNSLNGIFTQVAFEVILPS